MKRILNLLATLAVLGSASAAPTNELQAALLRLNSAPSYAWTTTTEIFGVPFSPGPQKGVYDAQGWARVSAEMNGATAEVVLHGTNGVAKTADGWKTAAELPAPQFGGGVPPDFSVMLGRMLLSVRTPSVEAAAIISKLQDVKSEGSVWSGKLSPEAATELASMRRGARGGGTPPKNAEGDVRYWLQDGKLQKYSVKVKSIVTLPDGSEREIGRTTTTEFSEIGTAKVEIPPEAKKALGK